MSSSVSFSQMSLVHGASIMTTRSRSILCRATSATKSTIGWNFLRSFATALRRPRAPLIFDTFPHG